jgi:pyruvate,water dikinase
MRWIRWFREVGLDDVALVGGKNASLGEMIRELEPLGVKVPDGFAVTAAAYRYFLDANDLGGILTEILAGLNREDVHDLAARGKRIRNLMLRGRVPEDLERELITSYHRLSEEAQLEEVEVAVRSSATAEDLPGASFAGQQETFLCVHGDAEVLDAFKRALASLFTARAIGYREDMGFNHMDVALSVGVQRMVRSDIASSGVMFTLDTESGFRDVVFLEGIWGLGENIVQGRVGPDSWLIHKPTLKAGFRPIISKTAGPKEFRLVRDEAGHRLRNLPVSQADRDRLTLNDDEVLQLARWACTIEDHYSKKRGTDTPMDIEWAKDGLTGELFIVQARPETVHSRRTSPVARFYEVVTPPAERGRVLAEGLAVGNAVATGAGRVIDNPKRMDLFRPGEILVTEITNPDWEPIMKLAAGIVTERGGRTSHAAIVARELGIPAVVGAVKATERIPSGATVSLSCAEGEAGRVYEGTLQFRVDEVDPRTLSETRTKIMMNVGNPEQALKLAQIPNDGVGLARMEFIFIGAVKAHPLALTRYEQLPPKQQREIDEVTRGYTDRREFFIDKLSLGIATIAAAFYPRPVILRFSDFKTNEYAHLIAGEHFEPNEENPMIGWRGASRYYHPDYKEGFLLEVAAVRRVREVMGLKNLKVMVPFCRTPEEGERVLEVMREGGLERGREELEVYVMAEIPSNILQADRFSEVFDGFSIGSNDLTQLTLGVDRDSERVAPLFDERNDSVKRACAMLLETAQQHGRKVGICGQAPSDYPDFAAFLVSHGIDSISLNPDSVVRTKRAIIETEAGLATPVAG